MSDSQNVDFGIERKHSTNLESESATSPFGVAPRSSMFLENLKWLNSEEAVMYLRLPSVGALRNLVYRRQIPFTKLGRSLRFDREELDRFLGSLTRHRRISI
jgi:excisionase family DNA binding protein